ncbi:transcription elongation factor GreA [Patescibacteria group bacterium]|nr:transcription elongation factor GreA [Patescibacteria group bacterium]
MEKEYLTKEKHEELLKELEYLTKTRRKEIAKELDSAGSMGDLRENSEYQQAREDQANLEQRISQIEMVLKDAVVVKGGSKEAVGVGSVVVLLKKGDKERIEYKIVGAEEASMAERKISAHSPLVQAMIGMKKGEEFSFVAPKGTMKYQIVEIK